MSWISLKVGISIGPIVSRSIDEALGARLERVTVFEMTPAAPVHLGEGSAA